MNQPLKALLFDLDGTLLDTAPDFIVVLNQLLVENDKAPLPDAIIRATVSSGARALIKLGFKIEEDNPKFETLRSRLLSLYSNHLADNTVPFSGINQLLAYCKKQDIAWGIVTNKPSRFTLPLMDQVIIESKPSVIICPDDVTHTKPHPEPLYLACKKLNIRPSEAIYIGDHSRDIDAGKNAGMITIAAAYGYIEDHSPAASWGADILVQSAHEITEYLMQHHSF